MFKINQKKAPSFCPDYMFRGPGGHYCKLNVAFDAKNSSYNARNPPSISLALMHDSVLTIESDHGKGTLVTHRGEVFYADIEFTEFVEAFESFVKSLGKATKKRKTTRRKSPKPLDMSQPDDTTHTL